MGLELADVGGFTALLEEGPRPETGVRLPARVGTQPRRCAAYGRAGSSIEEHHGW